MARSFAFASAIAAGDTGAGAAARSGPGAGGAGAGAGAGAGVAGSDAGGRPAPPPEQAPAIATATVTAATANELRPGVIRTPLGITAPLERGSRTPPGCYPRAVRAIVLCGLVGLSACSTSIGGPCSLDDPCDEGVCNLSGAGEPVCIESDGDLDGDGLPNKRDFCNQEPGGAFDEDGDGLGDQCDRCPIARPPATPDADGDEVDSPCDPDPVLPGDKIAVFEGFNDALPATWRKEGTWETRGGEAVFTSIDPNMVQSLTTTLPLAARHLAVLGSYRVDRLDPAASQNFAGVTVADRRPAGTSIASCGGSRIGGMDTLLFTSDAGSSTKPFTTLFDPAGLYRVAQRIDNAQGGCAMISDAQSGAVQQMTAGELFAEAGLAARALDVRFQYLLVVQRP